MFDGRLSLGFRSAFADSLGERGSAQADQLMALRAASGHVHME